MDVRNFRVLKSYGLGPFVVSSLVSSSMLRPKLFKHSVSLVPASPSQNANPSTCRH